MKNRNLWGRIAGFALLGLGIGLTGCKENRADVLYINGVVHTLNANNDIAQAVAVADGKVGATGKTNDLTFAYNADTTIDLRGRAMYPGVFDAHCHFYGYASTLGQVNLVGTTSWEEVLMLVEAFAKENPEGWLVGRGWDQNDWAAQSFPTRK